VRYVGTDHNVIRYHCRPALFRDGDGNGGIGFGALRVEALVVEEFFRVLKPEGLRAATEAAETLASVSGRRGDEGCRSDCATHD
jgi:hypothetical protein